MTTKTLQGTLLDAAGTPLGSATIRFVATSTRSIVNSITTDFPVSGSGGYNINLAHGVYTIQIKRAEETAFRTVCANAYIASPGISTLEDIIKEQSLIQEADDTVIARMLQILSQTTAQANTATNAAASVGASVTVASNAAQTATVKAQESKDAATTAQTAASSAASSSTAAQNAVSTINTAATTATNAATTATNKALEASNSATAAANSSTSAATSATNAATSATAANTSASNAATSATTAATSATSAVAAKDFVNEKATLATNAATLASSKADAAAASAASASTSATNAATSATAASTSSANASTSATNAAASATSASTSATNAATSATGASTSATNAANSAQAATTSASSAAAAKDFVSEKATLATNAASAASASASTASSEAEAASVSASSADASAIVATNKATTATNKALEASNSAVAAANSSTTAAQAATDAATSAASVGNQAASAAASAASAVAAKDFVSEQTVLATNAATSASASATLASSKADAAGMSATAANSSASLASDKASAAAASASSAASTVTQVENKAAEANQSALDAAASASEAAISATLASGALIEAGSTDLSSGVYPTPIKDSLGNNRSCFWKVVVGGTVGTENYGVGDSLVYSRELSGYYKIDNTEAVSSVNGKQGVVVLTANDLNLGHVDNTSDLNKPLSTATTDALLTKAPISHVGSVGESQHGLATQTVAGFMSSTDKIKLDNISEVSGVSSVNSKTGDVVLTKADIGLSLVNNTADLDKPISTATQAALDTKYSPTNKPTAADVGALASGGTAVAAAKLATARTIAGKLFDGTADISITANDVGLSNVNNTSDINKPISTAQQSALDLKANLASPALTGTPSAPTAAVGTSTTQIATTAFVNAEIANDAAPSSHVGATGTAHGVATTSVAGFMSAADKTKLEGIATGANAYVHPTSGVTAGTYKSVTVDANGHVTSGTNPSTVDGYGITDAAKVHSSVNFGGWITPISTADFITQLTNLGAFSSMYWCTKAGWSYVDNNYITDTGVGTIQLAGCTVEVIGGSTAAYTIRIHTSPTVSIEGAVPNAEFVYVNHGPDYLPKWHKIYNTDNKPSPTDIGALPSGDYNPRKDSLTSHGFASGHIINVDLNTLGAGDTGLYEAASCANSPGTAVGAFFYVETKNIYHIGGSPALLQTAQPYDASGFFWRNYSLNTHSWTPWYQLYDSKNRPTAADVGALPSSGTAADSAKLNGQTADYYNGGRYLGYIAHDLQPSQYQTNGTGTSVIGGYSNGAPTTYGETLHIQGAGNGAVQIYADWGTGPLGNSASPSGNQGGMWVRACRDNGNQWTNWAQVYTTHYKPTADDVGLGLANNTSDVDKPISTATQAALDTKAATNHVHGLATTSVAGFMSSADKTKLDGLGSGGAATNADRLTTPRLINGTSFDGTSNISTANWGTSRTITIGGTSKTVNGGSDVSWGAGELGCLPITGGTLTGTLTLYGQPLRVSRGPGYSDYFHVHMDSGVPTISTQVGTSGFKVMTGSSMVMFLVNESGELYANGVHRVYHAGNKPTAEDVGALPTSGTAAAATKLATARTIAGKSFDGTANISIAASDVGALSTSGGTISGGINVGDSIKFTSTSSLGIMNSFGRSIARGSNVATNVFGNTTDAMYFDGNSLTAWQVRYNSTLYPIYHTGNKPTPAEIGAQPATSDSRVKSNITSLPPVLDKIMLIDPKTFTMEGREGTCVGTIAQDWEVDFPEVILNVPSTSQGEPEMLKGIDALGTIGILLKAIQELKAEIDELKNR